MTASSLQLPFFRPFAILSVIFWQPPIYNPTLLAFSISSLRNSSQFTAFALWDPVVNCDLSSKVIKAPKRTRPSEFVISMILINHWLPKVWAWSAWWRNQMEIFSALVAICAGNSQVPGEFPAQSPVARSFDILFDLRLNKRLSKQWWGWLFETLSRQLWCHCNLDSSPTF